MNTNRYLSYLDLMCCGFGGAVLMFLIVASSRPELRPTDQILVVRCRTDWERMGATADSVPPAANRAHPPRAEVGIEFRRAGELVWQRGNPRESTINSWMFIAPSEEGSGSETVIVWRQPLMGGWEFRPYLIDFPSPRVFGTADPSQSNGQASASDVATSVPVKLEIRGRRLHVEGNASSQLRLPGETGPTLKVDLL